jgi:protein TonB
MTAYAFPSPPLFSRRTTIFVLIVGLHVFLVYAIQTGLHRGISQVLPEPMVTQFLQDEVKPRDPPPPPPQVDFTPTKVEMVPPDITIDVPVGTTAIQPLVQPTEQPVPTAPVQPVAVKRVMGGPGKGFPNTEDYYPPTARRMGEEGMAITNVCVDERGKLTGDPTIASSSGSARLDEGALKLARAGSGRYRPTTEDGRPVSSCFQMRIRYTLN